MNHIFTHKSFSITIITSGVTVLLKLCFHKSNVGCLAIDLESASILKLLYSAFFINFSLK